MTARNEYLARIAREYLDNMIERLNEGFNGEMEIMAFIREQAQGDFDEVMCELPE